MDELKALWKGVWLKSSLSRFAFMFHAAVISISSDVPATRKICGLKSHSALLGWSRCLKNFSGSLGKKGITQDSTEIRGIPVPGKTIGAKL